MRVIFAIEPGPQQRSRLDAIRDQANRYFPPPKYEVRFDEHCPSYLTIVITVMVKPDPPYGSFGQYFVFPGERAIGVEWDKKIQIEY
jgi:hypothetical protein